MVPELCFLTGLDEDMKTNFQLKRALDSHMKSAPTERAKSLMKFRNDLATNEAAKTRLQKWNIGFSKDLVQISARKLDSETIIFGSGRPNQSNEVIITIITIRQCLCFLQGPQ